MSQVVDDMLDGFTCQQCGAFVDGEAPGYPRSCEDCESEADEDEQTCRNCGYTWDNACPGGCHWVEEDLCSCCAKSDWD